MGAGGHNKTEKITVSRFMTPGYLYFDIYDVKRWRQHKGVMNYTVARRKKLKQKLAKINLFSRVMKSA